MAAINPPLVKVDWVDFCRANLSKLVWHQWFLRFKMFAVRIFFRKFVLYGSLWISSMLHGQAFDFLSQLSTGR